MVINIKVCKTKWVKYLEVVIKKQASVLLIK